MKTGILESKKYVVSTIPTGYTPFIISHWKYNGNANDSIGTNHGTATSVTYPIVNTIQMADFSSSTSSKISVPDVDNLSFGNGTIDVDFSIDFLVYFNAVNNCWLINKRFGGAYNMEYYCEVLNGTLRFLLVDQSAQAYRFKTYTFTPSTGVIYHFGYTHISGTLKIYKNGIDVGGVQQDQGPYISMENSIEPLIMGKSGTVTSISFNGKLGVQTFWNQGLTPSGMLDVATKKLNGTPIF